MDVGNKGRTVAFGRAAELDRGPGGGDAGALRLDGAGVRQAPVRRRVPALRRAVRPRDQRDPRTSPGYMRVARFTVKDKWASSHATLEISQRARNGTVDVEFQSANTPGPGPQRLQGLRWKRGRRGVHAQGLGRGVGPLRPEERGQRLPERHRVPPLVLLPQPRGDPVRDRPGGVAAVGVGARGQGGHGVDRGVRRLDRAAPLRRQPASSRPSTGRAWEASP